MFKKIICILLLTSISIFAEEKKVEKGLWEKYQNPFSGILCTFFYFNNYLGYRRSELNHLEIEKNIYLLGGLGYENKTEQFRGNYLIYIAGFADIQASGAKYSNSAAKNNLNFTYGFSLISLIMFIYEYNYYNSGEKLKTESSFNPILNLSPNAGQIGIGFRF